MEHHHCHDCAHDHHAPVMAPVPGEAIDLLLAATFPSQDTRFISIFASDNKLYTVPVPTRYPEGLLEQVSDIFGSETNGFFLVAANLSPPKHDLRFLVQELPFLKILFALAHLGHRIVIYHGAIEHLPAVARDADVVIADEIHFPNLSPEFKSIVTSAAPNAEFYIGGHNSQTLNEWQDQ